MPNATATAARFAVSVLAPSTKMWRKLARRCKPRDRNLLSIIGEVGEEDVGQVLVCATDCIVNERQRIQDLQICCPEFSHPSVVNFVPDLSFRIAHRSRHRSVKTFNFI